MATEINLEPISEDQRLENKNIFLNKIIEEVPAMRVHRVVVREDVTEISEMWPTDKVISELNEIERAKVNLRRIFETEIILDIEEPERIDEIIQKLNEKKWCYDVWFTGSRGYHISLTFFDLKFFDIMHRNAIRKKIIREFNCDESKSSERTWIALEWEHHFKCVETPTTTKRLVYSKPGENKVPEEVISYVENLIELQKSQVLEKDEDFKNFLDDPYLKWAINPETEIKNGMRNEVLFKNMAIGLAKCGLSKHEALKVGQQICNNCPGKHIGEFEGWLDKAFQGELREYNKDEMFQWALKQGHPLLYESSIKEDEHMSLLSVKNLWEVIWNNKITAQPIWRELCFYNMIGTILDERKEDLRIHVIFTSDSSSGKDEGINLEEWFLNELNITTSTPSSITDKTLIGNVNEMIKEINTKYALQNPGDSVTRGKSTINYRSPIEKGELSFVNWMAIPESEFVFNPSSHNRQLQTILRQAMDPKRRIQKGVAGSMIDINTNTSFIITTFPIPEVMVKILNNGLFQRSLYYARTLSDEDRDKIDKGIRLKLFNKTIKKHYSEDKYKKLLLERLITLKNWYDENKGLISGYEGMDTYIGNRFLEYKEKYFKDLEYTEKQILSAIVTRGHIIINKLIKINAIYKMKLVKNSEGLEECIIDKSDVDEAFDLFIPCIDSVRRLMVDTSSYEKNIIKLCLLLKNKRMPRMELHKLMAARLGLRSPNKRTEILKRAIERGLLQEEKEGRESFLFLARTE